MPKVNRVTITALKDNVLVRTAVKLTAYRNNPGLEGTGRPEGQETHDEQVHGVTLRLGQILELDLRDDQLGYLRESVNAGDVECIGLPGVDDASSAEKIVVSPGPLAAPPQPQNPPPARAAPGEITTTFSDDDNAKGKRK